MRKGLVNVLLVEILFNCSNGICGEIRGPEKLATCNADTLQTIAIERAANVLDLLKAVSLLPAAKENDAEKSFLVSVINANVSTSGTLFLQMIYCENKNQNLTIDQGHLEKMLKLLSSEAPDTGLRQRFIQETNLKIGSESYVLLFALVAAERAGFHVSS